MGSKPRANANANATPSELIDRYIAQRADWRGVMLARIRRAFLEADPDIVEEWKWMGSPVWSRDGLLAVANAHKEKVKVTFQHGARLPDPHRLFNAGLGGNKWRAIDLYEGDDLDAYALRELVQAAAAYNGSRKRR